MGNPKLIGWEEETFYKTQNFTENLLKYLFKHQIKSEFVYGFEWEENCLALWSNYVVLHSPVNDFTGVDRVMHRITIQ